MEDNKEQPSGEQELENQTRNQYSGSGDFAPGPPESNQLQSDPSETANDQDQTEIAKQKTAAATDPEKLDKI